MFGLDPCPTCGDLPIHHCRPKVEEDQATLFMLTRWLMEHHSPSYQTLAEQMLKVFSISRKEKP